MTREEAIECLSERVSIGKTCEQSCMVGFGVNIDTLDEAFDMAISALRQQETVTNRNGLNEPLTLDELRKMDGEPVWVVYGEDAGMWALVEVLEASIFLTNNLGGRSEYAADVELEDDGITVYRQKSEGTV